MDEHSYFEQLISRSLDGALTGEEDVALEFHLASCPRCRAVMEELGELHRCLGFWQEREVPEGFAEAVMERVRAEAPAKRRLAWLRPLCTLAACAVFLLGISRLGLWSMGGGNSGGSTSSSGSSSSSSGAGSAAGAASQSAVDSYALTEGELEADGAETEEYAVARSEFDAGSAPQEAEQPAAAPQEKEDSFGETELAQGSPARFELADAVQEALGVTPGRILILGELPEQYAQEGWIGTEDFLFLALDSDPEGELAAAGQELELGEGPCVLAVPAR